MGRVYRYVDRSERKAFCARADEASLIGKGFTPFATRLFCIRADEASLIGIRLYAYYYRPFAVFLLPTNPFFFSPLFFAFLPAAFRTLPHENRLSTVSSMPVFRLKKKKFQRKKQR